MTLGFAITFQRLAEEGRDRCRVITAIIDFAAPPKPLQLVVPADATPALREVIEASNRRAIASNHRLRNIERKYLPSPC
jgi:hypothetical protein